MGQLSPWGCIGNSSIVKALPPRAENTTELSRGFCCFPPLDRKVDASFQSPTTVTHSCSGQVVGGDTKSRSISALQVQSGHLSAMVVSSFRPGLGGGKPK